MGVDLNFFFYSSPSQEVRDDYEDALIESYQKYLAETLTRLQYKSKIPTLSDVKKSFIDFSFYGKFEWI